MWNSGIGLDLDGHSALTRSGGIMSFGWISCLFWEAFELLFWGLQSVFLFTRTKRHLWFISYLEWGWASLIRCFLHMRHFRLIIWSLTNDIIKHWYHLLIKRKLLEEKEHKYCHLPPPSGDSKPMFPSYSLHNIYFTKKLGTAHIDGLCTDVCTPCFEEG